MVRLFIAEILYRKWVALAILAVIPSLGFYAGVQFRSLTPTYIFFWCLIILLQNMIIMRNRDKRDRLFSLLPVSRLSNGLFRPLQITLLALAYMGLYALVMHIMQPQGASSLKSLTALVCLICGLFSGYFAFKDAFVPWFRRKGVTRERFIMTAVLLGLALQILGLVAFMQVSAGKKVNIPIFPWIDWLVQHHPFQGIAGYGRMVATALILAIVSLVTYMKKKNYVE